jgi:hypothetical protein
MPDEAFAKPEAEAFMLPSLLVHGAHSVPLPSPVHSRATRLASAAELSFLRRLKVLHDTLAVAYSSCKSSLPHLVALEQAVARSTETVSETANKEVTQELVHRSYKRKRFRFDGHMKAASCVSSILAIQSDSPAQTALELTRGGPVSESLQNAKSLFDAEVALVRDGVTIRRIWVVPKIEFQNVETKRALDSLALEMARNGILVRFVVPEDLDTEDNEALKDTMIIDGQFCQRLEVNERFKAEKDYKMDAHWYFDKTMVESCVRMFESLWRKGVEPERTGAHEVHFVEDPASSQQSVTMPGGSGGLIRVTSVGSISGFFEFDVVSAAEGHDGVADGVMDSFYEDLSEPEAKRRRTDGSL